MDKHFTQWTRKEFEALPFRGDFNTPVECDSLVIMPTRRLHDSGYRCMDFVAVDSEGKPLCRNSGCSDVLNIDGIGGLSGFSGHPNAWNIDCLPKSGLLRLWIYRKKIIVGSALSNMEIVGKEVDYA